MTANTLIFRAAMAIALAMALAGSAKAESSGTQVLEGVIGKAPVVMKLELDDGSVDGVYFYKRFKHDIDLNGGSNDGTLQLNSEVTGDVLTLTPVGPNFVGQLRTRKGVVSPISLHPAALAKDEAGRLAQLMPGAADDIYEMLRMQDTVFIPQRTETRGGRTIRWYVERVSGLSLFRLESGYSAPVMAAINQSLNRQHIAEADAYFSCIGSDGASGMDGSASSEPYLSDDYVSFTWHSSWYCNHAAHPDFSTTGTTFDARTGRELRLEDILWFGKGAPPKSDLDAWMDYRDKTFAPALVALLTRLYPKAMAAPKGGHDCDYTNPDDWSFPSWSLNEHGLWLGAYFFRAERVCDNAEFSVIPYAVLKRMKGVER